MKHAFRAVLLLCLAAVAARGEGEAAGDVPGVDRAVPRDSREKWVVGIAALEVEGLSTENAYLAHAIPLLIRDGIARLPWHELSDEERGLARQAIVSRERAALAQSIAKLRSERDEAVFLEAKPGQSAAQTAAAGRAASEKNLALQVARSDFLASVDHRLIEVAPRKPLAIAEGSSPGMLFDPPAMSPQEFCAAHELDMLIAGAIREVQGYLRLDIVAWDAARGKELFRWREAGSREELYASLESAVGNLTEPVLGRPWASLAVRTEPDIAIVEVDGETVSAGGPRTLYLTPGTHEVRASAPGHREEMQRVDLAAGEARALTLILQSLESTTLTIASDPPGADLYLDSLWMGKTPLAIGLPAERSRVLLSLQGYLDLPFSLGPGTTVPGLLRLEPQAASRDEQQKKARDRFYAAFGWFLVSLPAPLFSYRYSYDFAAKAQDLLDAGDTAGAERAVSVGTALYWASVGGVALSASLFGWVVSAIIRYIAVSDRAAG